MLRNSQNSLRPRSFSINNKTTKEFYKSYTKSKINCSFPLIQPSISRKDSISSCSSIMKPRMNRNRSMLYKSVDIFKSNLNDNNIDQNTINNNINNLKNSSHSYVSKNTMNSVSMKNKSVINGPYKIKNVVKQSIYEKTKEKLLRGVYGEELLNYFKKRKKEKKKIVIPRNERKYREKIYEKFLANGTSRENLRKMKFTFEYMDETNNKFLNYSNYINIKMRYAAINEILGYDISDNK